MYEYDFHCLTSYAPQAYLSILYLKIPETFTIVLRGQLVEHRNLVLDLKFQEFIVYRPQTGGCKEVLLANFLLVQLLSALH